MWLSEREWLRPVLRVEKTVLRTNKDALDWLDATSTRGRTSEDALEPLDTAGRGEREREGEGQGEGQEAAQVTKEGGREGEAEPVQLPVDARSQPHVPAEVHRPQPRRPGRSPSGNRSLGTAGDARH